MYKNILLCKVGKACNACTPPESQEVHSDEIIFLVSIFGLLNDDDNGAADVAYLDFFVTFFLSMMSLFEFLISHLSLFPFFALVLGSFFSPVTTQQNGRIPFFDEEFVRLMLINTMLKISNNLFVILNRENKTEKIKIYYIFGIFI